LQAAYHGLHRSGAARWHRRSGCVVFCYHNVVPDDITGRVGVPSLHVSVSEFSEQIDWIADSFEVVPVDEVLSRLRRGRSVAGLAALTFDDGYAGAIRHAIPVMRRAGVPFTLFPVISSADERRPFWWDLAGIVETAQRERYITALEGDREQIVHDHPGVVDLPDDALPASWDMLRAILGSDCTIGVHGVTHRNLAVLPGEDIAWELTHARTRLREELDVTADVIAYPYGRSSPAVQAATERAGFRAGLTNNTGLVREGINPFELGRINVPAGLSLATFACWASGLKLRI
jgi:peptidoglycan/xylan/chitin deacetylase (PgdA/CDA1 family)